MDYFSLYCEFLLEFGLFAISAVKDLPYLARAILVEFNPHPIPLLHCTSSLRSSKSEHRLSAIITRIQISIIAWFLSGSIVFVYKQRVYSIFFGPRYLSCHFVLLDPHPSDIHIIVWHMPFLPLYSLLLYGLQFIHMVFKHHHTVVYFLVRPA